MLVWRSVKKPAFDRSPGIIHLLIFSAFVTLAITWKPAQPNHWKQAYVFPPAWHHWAMTCFPALGTVFMFSRAWRGFPRVGFVFWLVHLCLLWLERLDMKGLLYLYTLMFCNKFYFDVSFKNGWEDRICPVIILLNAFKLLDSPTILYERLLNWEKCSEVAKY